MDGSERARGADDTGTTLDRSGYTIILDTRTINVPTRSARSAELMS